MLKTARGRRRGARRGEERVVSGAEGEAGEGGRGEGLREVTPEELNRARGLPDSRIDTVGQRSTFVDPHAYATFSASDGGRPFSDFIFEFSVLYNYFEHGRH